MADTAARLLSRKRVSADAFCDLAAVWRRLHCNFAQIPAKIWAGRTQAAFLLKRGVRADRSPALQEYRSRGCLRAHVSYSVFACWPLWLLVQRKKSLSLSLKSQFRLSLPSPVSTSKTIWRARRGNLVWHALCAAPLFKLGAPFGMAGLSDPYDPVLRATAVAKLQDRSLC
jgi:hypothetical protein